jgi:TrkA domain protein
MWDHGNMTRIEETQLPGLGVRYDFTTEDGRRVGVIHHRTGRREMFVCPADDPDRAIMALNLDDDDARTLVDALGGSQVVERLGKLQQAIEGLAIDWLTVAPESAYAGRSIGDAQIRTRTGASVVAVIRSDQAFPAPGPEFQMEPADVLVVVGTAPGIEMVRDILLSG